MRAALPFGVAGLILTIILVVAYPPTQPFYVVQSLFAVSLAGYLIWLGWQWRNGRPSA